MKAEGEGRKGFIARSLLLLRYIHMIPALKLKVKEKKTKEAQRRRKLFVVHEDRESKVFGISNKGMLWI